MKVFLESTHKVITIVIEGVEVPAQIWEGRSASGIPVQVYVTRILPTQHEDVREFEAELRESRAPSIAVQAIPERVAL